MCVLAACLVCVWRSPPHQEGIVVTQRIVRFISNHLCRYGRMVALGFTLLYLGESKMLFEMKKRVQRESECVSNLVVGSHRACVFAMLVRMQSSSHRICNDALNVHCHLTFLYHTTTDPTFCSTCFICCVLPLSSLAPPTPLRDAASQETAEFMLHTNCYPVQEHVYP